MSEELTINRVGTITEFLTTEGFRPEMVDEDSVKFKYEGNWIWVETSPRDTNFYSVTSAYLANINTTADLERSRELACSISTDKKVIKFGYSPDKSKVLVLAEGVYADVDSFIAVLPTLIGFVIGGTATYTEAW